MSVPEYVPTSNPMRFALSLPRVPVGSGRVRRPAELGAHPFTPGPGPGCTGPDSGYALALARSWEPIVVPGAGERLEDAVAVAAAVAMTRAACARRGPEAAPAELTSPPPQHRTRTTERRHTRRRLVRRHATPARYR